MAYDLLIRNGRIIDGSGMPSFRGDVAVRAGKIVELDKLNGAAAHGSVQQPGPDSAQARRVERAGVLNVTL